MKIAVFATGWNGEYLRHMHKGLEQAQREFDDEIHLYASFGRLGSGDSFNKSEFDFFELAELGNYDGFLYPSTTIKEEDVKQRLIRRIVASGKPCVSLEEEIDGMSFVGINQWDAMRQMVAHLAKVHDIHTFGFINGIRDTYEANMRLGGVKSMIDELQLTLLADWVAHENYEYKAGYAYGKRLVCAYELGDTIPDAVISANDMMAAACLDALKDTSLEGKLPITGFDRYFDGESYSPTLTTIERPRSLVAVEAVRLLHEVYEDKEQRVARHRELPYQFFTGNTCGCGQKVAFDIENYRNRMFRKNLGEQESKAKLDCLQEWITSCSSLEEIMKAMSDYLALVGASHARVELTNDLSSEEMREYASCKVCALDWLNPEYKGMDRTVEVYLPLHYCSHRMGYCVIGGAQEMFLSGILEAFFRNLSYALENYIQRTQYRNVSQKLQRLYRVDQLTGIYNRFGMEELGARFFRENCEQQINTRFIFCDVNRLKFINDTYGHKAGDWAIKKTGEALARLSMCHESQSVDDGLAFRYGGDEFLLMIREGSAIDAASIRAMIEKVSTEEKPPIAEKLEVSIGEITAQWDGGEDMDAYLNGADEAMYEDKKRYHEKYDRRSKRR